MSASSPSINPPPPSSSWSLQSAQLFQVCLILLNFFLAASRAASSFAAASASSCLFPSIFAAASWAFGVKQIQHGNTKRFRFRFVLEGAFIRESHSLNDKVCGLCHTLHKMVVHRFQQMHAVPPIDYPHQRCGFFRNYFQKIGLHFVNKMRQ